MIKKKISSPKLSISLEEMDKIKETGKKQTSIDKKNRAEARKKTPKSEYKTKNIFTSKKK